MLRFLKVQNFKSWERVAVKFAPLTGFFGPNSSGKTSLLQFLLLIKQTVHHADRQIPLFLGDMHSPIDLGTFEDIVFNHDSGREFSWEFRWRLPHPLSVTIQRRSRKGWEQHALKLDTLHFQAEIRKISQRVLTTFMAYTLPDQHGPFTVGMRYEPTKKQPRRPFELFWEPENHPLKPVRAPGRPWKLPYPVKFYGFPEEVRLYYQNAGWLFDLQVQFENLWDHIFYLGPLREYPHRQYIWSGVAPKDVGPRGERCIEALLASRGKGRYISRGRGKRKATLEESVARGLKMMGLVHDFRIIPLREDDKIFRAEVRIHKSSPWCNLTDVGFGVSQVIPVITLLYYVPDHSVVILEQPEIHLHPSAQSALADVLIDAIQKRHIQVILESHSEYLLKRLQRRIAEEHIASKDVALYFVTTGEKGESSLMPLEVDLFGRILNWPENFFGDEFGEIMEMENAIARRIAHRMERSHQHSTIREK